MARSDTARAIEALLDREREALITGRLDGLEALHRDKTRLLARAGEIGDTAAARRVRDKAERNQALLAAAADGLRSARTRVANIRSGLSDLSTYSADGARAPIGPGPAKLERRS